MLPSSHPYPASPGDGWIWAEPSHWWAWPRSLTSTRRRVTLWRFGPSSFRMTRKRATLSRPLSAAERATLVVVTATFRHALSSREMAATSKYCQVYRFRAPQLWPVHSFSGSRRDGVLLLLMLLRISKTPIEDSRGSVFRVCFSDLRPWGFAPPVGPCWWRIRC